MGRQHENDEIEIGLKELFFEVLGEWKKVVASAVLAGVIMFVISTFIITPKYESTSKLYLIKENSISNLTDLQLGSNLANDYMEIINDRPILEQVIKNLQLDMNHSQLLRCLEFKNPSNTRLSEITATHQDPLVAKAIVDEMADVAKGIIKEKMGQEEPSVLQHGYIAINPVSPSITKNTVLGAFVGAFLAIAVVVISYLMNDTIMTPEDMERKIGVNVLASLPFDEEEDDGIKTNQKKTKVSAQKKTDEERRAEVLKKIEKEKQANANKKGERR